MWFRVLIAQEERIPSVKYNNKKKASHKHTASPSSNHKRKKQAAEHLNAADDGVMVG